MAARTSSPPDGRLNTDDPQVRAAAAKAIDKLTTPFKKGYVPPGVVNWNDADDNNAFHAKLMVMDFDGTISTEVAIYRQKRGLRRHRDPRSAARQ